MNPIVGWSLAAVAVALGHVQWGWPGVALAVSVIVFWLLLQFSRALRVMRMAGQAPVGQIDNAVMLHSKLKPGMRLIDVLPLTRSLGNKTCDEPETFEWVDGSGTRVQIEFVAGRCVAWHLVRRDDAAERAAAPSEARAIDGA